MVTPAMRQPPHPTVPLELMDCALEGIAWRTASSTSPSAWACSERTEAGAAVNNAKALSTYMGHSSITITLDRYGHLMPGNEEEAAEMARALPRRSAA